MEVWGLYSDKGGVTKTSSILNLAASLKALQPDARIAVMDLCPDHGHLSKRYAMEREQAFEGVFRVVEVMTDPRQSSKENISQAVRASVGAIQVIPGTDEERGCISFINIGVALGKRFRSIPELTNPNTCHQFGQKLLEAYEAELGLDFIFVDLPGAVDEVMVRAVLPNCACVAIPIDVRDSINLAEADTLVAKLRERGVEPSAFLKTFVEPGGKAPSSQIYAEECLAELSQIVGVPVLPGGIPNRPSMVNALVPADSEIEGIPQSAGVYMAAAAKGITAGQRGVYLRAIGSFEGTVEQMLSPTTATQVG